MALKKSEGAAEAAPAEVKEDEKPKAKEPKASVPEPKEITLTNQSHNATGEIGVYVGKTEVYVQADKGKITLKYDGEGMAARDALLKVGWTDHTVYPVHRQPEAPPPTVKIGKKWYFRHPEALPNEPVNCNIGFYINGEEVSVEVIDSKVITENKDVALAVEKHGYVCEKIDFE